jgi:hypothetical protein
MKQDHQNLIQSMEDNTTIHSLLKMTLTLDQAKVVLTMLDSIRNSSQSLEESSLSV